MHTIFVTGVPGSGKTIVIAELCKANPQYTTLPIKNREKATTSHAIGFVEIPLSDINMYANEIRRQDLILLHIDEITATMRCNELLTDYTKLDGLLAAFTQLELAKSLATAIVDATKPLDNIVDKVQTRLEKKYLITNIDQLQIPVSIQIK